MFDGEEKSTEDEEARVAILTNVAQIFVPDCMRTGSFWLNLKEKKDMMEKVLSLYSHEKEIILPIKTSGQSSYLKFVGLVVLVVTQHTSHTELSTSFFSHFFIINFFSHFRS